MVRRRRRSTASTNTAAARIAPSTFSRSSSRSSTTRCAAADDDRARKQQHPSSTDESLSSFVRSQQQQQPLLLRRSELISRFELSKLSGGGKSNSGSRAITTKNPLGLLSPISYVGGPAVATKRGKVSHIVIKESINEPLLLPTTMTTRRECAEDEEVEEEAHHPYFYNYTLNRCAKHHGKLPRDVTILYEQVVEAARKKKQRELLQELQSVRDENDDDDDQSEDDDEEYVEEDDYDAEEEEEEEEERQQPIPMFWEPLGQRDGETGRLTTKVQYVGHWVVVDVEKENFTYKSVPRCARIKLQLASFVEEFARVIDDAVLLLSTTTTTTTTLKSRSDVAAVSRISNSAMRLQTPATTNSSMFASRLLLRRDSAHLRSSEEEEDVAKNVTDPPYTGAETAAAAAAATAATEPDTTNQLSHPQPRRSCTKKSNTVSTAYADSRVHSDVKEATSEVNSSNEKPSAPTITPPEGRKRKRSICNGDSATAAIKSEEDNVEKRKAAPLPPRRRPPPSSPPLPLAAASAAAAPSFATASPAGFPTSRSLEQSGEDSDCVIIDMNQFKEERSKSAAAAAADAAAAAMSSSQEQSDNDSDCIIIDHKSVKEEKGDRKKNEEEQKRQITAVDEREQVVAHYGSVDELWEAMRDFFAVVDVAEGASTERRNNANDAMIDCETELQKRLRRMLFNNKYRCRLADAVNISDAVFREHLQKLGNM